jgi:hypothetical protein
MTINRFFLFRALVFITLMTDVMIADAQLKTCADLKAGDFYYYPRNTLQQYHVVVSGDMQKTVSMTGRKGSSHRDSIVYKIEWMGSCMYTLKYVEGDGLSEDDQKSLTRHKLVYHIDSIGEDYYLFSYFQDRFSSDRLLGKDTMWMHPQAHDAGNLVFGQTDPNRIRKVHFSDTSKMALLYIYRLGKFKLSFSDLYIFYNELPMVVLKNKSAAVIAIFKEGPFTLRSRVTGTNVEGDLPMDIKFGKVYYVRADMIWGIHWTGNTKLEFTVMDLNEGKQDFDGIYEVQ